MRPGPSTAVLSAAAGGPATTDLVLLVGALVLCTVLVGLLMGTGRPASRGGGRGRHALPAPEPLTHEEEHMPVPAVVYNPTKVGDVEKVKRDLGALCAEHGWSEPLWFETTEDDPGVGQAKQALGAGADVVMACGGDGTVRCVAETLAGSGVAMGLLPAGTGNLLARNMDMELDDLVNAARVALTGDDRHVDVGWLKVDGSAEEQAFLVMAGMGFDAQIMAGAPEGLKAKVGPFAYVVAGLKTFNGDRIRVHMTIDGQPAFSRRMRTILIGNCGKLLGGLVLMPDAVIDDGRLDVISIAPQGIAGWTAVAARVITRQRKGHQRVEHWTVQEITVRAEHPQEAQLDGDSIGMVTELAVRVDPGALVVRVEERRTTSVVAKAVEAARGAAQVATAPMRPGGGP